MQFKINIGDMAEDAVQTAVEDAFSSDFVFRSPRRENAEEVTDVLVLFNDVGLVIQSKAQAISLGGYDSDKSLDWAAKNLAKAGRQVGGAIRAIRADRMIYVENTRRGRIPFRKDEFPWLYGLIILHHRSEAYDPFSLVPALREIKAPAHTLSFRDFWNLSRLLDTPGDLINYLEHRTDVLVPTLNPRVHEEESAFKYYLDNLEDIMALRAKERGVNLNANDVRPYADNLRKVVTGKQPSLKAGLVIDHMIEKIHDVDPNLEAIDVGGQIIPRSDSAKYVRIATELGKISRVRRIALGKLYLKVAKLAAESGKQHFQLTHSHKRSDCMLFVASPLPRNARKARAKELLDLTMLAKNYHQVDRAIGVATEPAGQMGSSYDMLFLESPPVPDESAQKLGREIFGASKTHLFEEL